MNLDTHLSPVGSGSVSTCVDENADIALRPVSIATTSTAVNGCSTHESEERTVEQFLTLNFDLMQGPTAFSWSYLRKFLGQNDIRSLDTLDDSFPDSGKCLLDSVTLNNLSEEAACEKDKVDTINHASEMDLGVCVKVKSDRKIVNAKQLLQHFRSKKEKKEVGRRTILFMTDMTPEYAVVIATQVNITYAEMVREYLQCHLTDESEFIAVMPQRQNKFAEKEWPRHIATKIEFVFGFHLPYVALRYNTAGSDPRGVRETIPMIKPLNSKPEQLPQDDLVCHEGQNSFLIVGHSSTEWFAVCNVDTWFGSEQNLNAYVKQNQDGPCGGARTSKDCSLHPREYFLLVLSQRFRQISHEWGNVFTHLTTQLDTYETHYLQTIDSVTGELHDDDSMSRTRSYLKAASMLRQYCDTITVITQRLESYLAANGQTLFGDFEGFEDQDNTYRSQMDWDLAHLNRWRKRLYSRMQRFEVMREGLLSATSLRESRRATKQSHDIGVLTYVTVLYLPFSTAATVIGMSGQLPVGKSWIYWAIGSIVLGIVTYFSAFGTKIVALFRRRQSGTVPGQRHDVEKFERKRRHSMRS